MAKEKEEETGTMRKMADAAIVVFISRVSGPALLGVCSYIAMSVMNLKTDVAALAAGVNATIAGIQTDVGDLKQWRNSFDLGRTNIHETDKNGNL